MSGTAQSKRKDSASSQQVIVSSGREGIDIDEKFAPPPNILVNSGRNSAPHDQHLITKNSKLKKLPKETAGERIRKDTWFTPCCAAIVFLIMLVWLFLPSFTGSSSAIAKGTGFEGGSNNDDTSFPTTSPINLATEPPVSSSLSPTSKPISEPTKSPTISTKSPTAKPTSKSPTAFPTPFQSSSPTETGPTQFPVVSPTPFPSIFPTVSPTPFPLQA